MSELAGLDPGTAVVVGLVALLAAALSAVTAFGGAVVLLPALVWAVGPRLAVPVLTVAQLAGNLARVGFNWRDVDWRVAGRFCLGAVPAAIVGSLAFAAAPATLLTKALGLFLLASVAYRWLRPGGLGRFPLAGFLPLGAGSGFLSAVLGSVGPVVAPFFLAHGLVKGAYIGTEAFGAAAMHLTKTVVYGRLALLDGAALLLGGALGLLMIAGSYLGKRVLDRLPAAWFARLIEAVLIVAGLQLLIVG